jgi:UDP-N-acetyl-D-galactosamine dehydrogenase
MEVKHEYALETTTALPNQRFDAIVLGVALRHFGFGFNFKNDTSLFVTLKVWVKCGWKL